MRRIHLKRSHRGGAWVACILAIMAGTACEPESEDLAGEVPTALQSCRFISGAQQGTDGAVALRADKAVTGLEVPWAIGFLPNGDWLVTERAGRVRRVSGGALAAAPVATITVGETGEGGLMGLAVDPSFASNRAFYVYYTASGGTENRLDRYRLSDDGASAALERNLVSGIPAGTFHNGGRLRFGPDGALYLGTGDGRDPNRSQDPASLAGKILRVSPEGGAPEVYVSGIRNTQGFDWWDDSTLVVSDHGPTGELGLDGLDAVGFARNGDNLGWPVVHGCEAREGFRAPFLAWEEALPPGGLVVYRGSAIPAFQGSILVTALGSKHLQRIGAGGENEVYLSGTAGFGRLRDIVQAPDGSVLVTTSNCDGRGSCGADRDAIVRITGG